MRNVRLIQESAMPEVACIQVRDVAMPIPITFDISEPGELQAEQFQHVIEHGETIRRFGLIYPVKTIVKDPLV